jgi:hypothetical protein
MINLLAIAAKINEGTVDSARKRACVCADDSRLGEYRKRDAAVHPAELRDLFGRP